MGQIVYQALLWLLLVQGCFAFHSTRRSLVSGTPCAGYGDLVVTIAGKGEITCGGKRSYKSLMYVKAPTFQYQAAKENVLYTIMIFHTGRPGCRTNLDYLVANVMGRDLANADKFNEDIFSFYNRPIVTRKPEFELRYFMYAFEQRYPLEGIAFSSGSLCDFDADKFDSEHGLKPVAANMFTTKP